MGNVKDLFPDGKPLNPMSDSYLGDVMGIISRAPIEHRTNEKANNALYVPIQISEEILDFLFPMGWSLEFKSLDWIANEIVATVELVIDCGPIKRRIVGIGAEPIQMASGTKDPTDMSKKNMNTLSKDAPNALSEAFKNACKKLGNVFGRNLNRRNADKTPFQSAELTPEYIVSQINSAPDAESLNEIYKGLPKLMQGTPAVVAAFKVKKDSFNQLPL